MYSLTTEEVEETRTRTVTKTGTRTVTNPDGTTHTEEYEYEEEEEYTVTILRVTLTVTPLESIVAGRMDSEQTEIFGAYTETKGGPFPAFCKLLWSDICLNNFLLDHNNFHLSVTSICL